MTLYVAPIPNKIDVYPERFPPFRHPIRSVKAVEQFLNGLRRAGVRVIDVLPALVNAKSSAVFDPYESHWTSEGIVAQPAPSRAPSIRASRRTGSRVGPAIRFATPSLMGAPTFPNGFTATARHSGIPLRSSRCGARTVTSTPRSKIRNTDPRRQLRQSRPLVEHEPRRPTGPPHRSSYPHLLQPAGQY